MMGTPSSSKMLDAIKSPPIGPESEQASPPSSTMEKRKHVGTGDSPPPSPPQTEKRIRVENFDHPPDLSPAGEQNHDGGGVENDEHPPDSSSPPGEQKPNKGVEIVEQPQNHDDRNPPAWVFERFKVEAERLKPFWDALGDNRWNYRRVCEEGCPDPDCGTDSGFTINQREGCQENVSPDACVTPILNFKEKHEFYHELRGFAEKAVAFFNDKNNQNLCFDDIESVESCHSSGTQYLLTVKAVDTGDANSVTVLRGKVRRGIKEAEVDDCELLTLAAY